MAKLKVTAELSDEDRELLKQFHEDVERLRGTNLHVDIWQPPVQFDKPYVPYPYTVPTIKPPIVTCETGEGK